MPVTVYMGIGLFAFIGSCLSLYIYNGIVFQLLFFISLSFASYSIYRRSYIYQDKLVLIQFYFRPNVIWFNEIYSIAIKTDNRGGEFFIITLKNKKVFSEIYFQSRDYTGLLTLFEENNIPFVLKLHEDRLKAIDKTGYFNNLSKRNELYLKKMHLKETKNKSLAPR